MRAAVDWLRPRRDTIDGGEAGRASLTVMLRRSAGFSLVEVMTTVSIVGVVALIAVPGISDVVNDARRVADLDRIEAALRDARNEARLRRVCVNVAAPALTNGAGTALRLAVDVACDGDFDDSGDVVREGVATGTVRFPDAVGGEGITFGPRGGLQSGSPAIIEGQAGRTVRRYRVLRAIGAVRRDS
jgi:prepilin-type N-terminal cleavage/methylation domain-containing protein